MFRVVNCINASMHAAISCIYDLLGRTQGRRKASKSCGGQASRGTVSIEKAPKKFFPEMLATGGGLISKKFLDIPIIFPDVLINSPEISDFSRKSQNFAGHKKFYQKITEFFRKYQNTKTNPIDIFHGGKGHFARSRKKGTFKFDATSSNLK